jgi:hypothetical protein
VTKPTWLLKMVQEAGLEPAISPRLNLLPQVTLRIERSLLCRGGLPISYSCIKWRRQLESNQRSLYGADCCLANRYNYRSVIPPKCSGLKKPAFLAMIGASLLASSHLDDTCKMVRMVGFEPTTDEHLSPATDSKSAPLPSYGNTLMKNEFVNRS